MPGPIQYGPTFDFLYPGVNVSPMVNTIGVTYEQIAATWRGPGSIPSSASLDTTWATVEANMAAAAQSAQSAYVAQQQSQLGIVPGSASIVGGVAVLDFGAFPGKPDASVAVTGQASIAAGANVLACIQATATAEHSADEHLVEPIFVVASNVVTGVGFTIRGVPTTSPLAYGRWSVVWRWAN